VDAITLEIDTEITVSHRLESTEIYLSKLVTQQDLSLNMKIIKKILFYFWISN